MIERSFDGKNMKDFLQKCIELIPVGLDAKLDDAEDNAGLDAAEVDNTEDHAKVDDAEDNASDDIVDLTNESVDENDSCRSSKRACQKPDWYRGARGGYSTDNDE